MPRPPSLQPRSSLLDPPPSCGPMIIRKKANVIWQPLSRTTTQHSTDSLPVRTTHTHYTGHWCSVTCSGRPRQTSPAVGASKQLLRSRAAFCLSVPCHHDHHHGKDEQAARIKTSITLTQRCVCGIFAGGWRTDGPPNSQSLLSPFQLTRTDS